MLTHYLDKKLYRLKKGKTRVCASRHHLTHTHIQKTNKKISSLAKFKYMSDSYIHITHTYILRLFFCDKHTELVELPKIRLIFFTNFQYVYMRCSVFVCFS